MSLSFLVSIAMLWVLGIVNFLMMLGMNHQLAALQELHNRKGALIPNDGLDVGKPAPKLLGTRPGGGEWVSLDDFTGQPVLLVFIAPNCGPCVDLVPHLNELAASRPDVKVVVVAQGGLGVTFPVPLSKDIVALEDLQNKVSTAYSVMRTPLAYAIDGTGQIRNKTVPNSLADLETTLIGGGRLQGGAPWITREP